MDVQKQGQNYAFGHCTAACCCNVARLQVNFQTALLQGCFNEFSAGRQVAKNYKRRKGFLKEAGLLPEVISISSQNPIPDNLVTALQVLTGSAL